MKETISELETMLEEAGSELCKKEAAIEVLQKEIEYSKKEADTQKDRMTTMQDKLKQNEIKLMKPIKAEMGAVN